jgi:hypothetical protein
MSISDLRRAYGEICRGYSEAKFFGQPVYMAHMTVFDQTEVDAYQARALEEAKKRGVPTEAERLKWLKECGIWTDKDEMDLIHQRDYVEGLRKTRKIVALKLQIEQLDKQIAEGVADLDKIAARKMDAIGLTAERVAEDKVQFEYIRLSFYRDRDLEYPLLSDEEMSKLSDEEMDELLMSYLSIVSRLTVDAVRRISVQPFFLNQFILCGDDISRFFGMPIVDLTIYQANLLSYGHYYRNVLSQNEFADDIARDPDKIDDAVNRARNFKAMNAKVDNQAGGFVGYVGATGDDFKAMGAEDGTSRMNQAATKQFRDGKDAAQHMGYTIVDKR